MIITAAALFKVIISLNKGFSSAREKLIYVV